MQPSGQKPDSAEPEVDLGARPLPFQWSLLAWAALVGTLTGGAVVAFHELLAFINNGLFGTFVEGFWPWAKANLPNSPRATADRPIHWHALAGPAAGGPGRPGLSATTTGCTRTATAAHLPAARLAQPLASGGGANPGGFVVGLIRRFGRPGTRPAEPDGDG